MWIQTRVTVRKRLSWVLTSVTLTFDPWPWPFAWTSLLSLVITPENFMMIRWWEHGEKGETDGQTDGLNQSYSCLVAAKNHTLKTTRQIWGIWRLRLAYSPETPNLGQNRWCFVPCDLEIWRMTLENDRASLLCCFKLCATFHSHWWIQTGVTVFRAVWPWNLTYDLEKTIRHLFYATSSFVHHFVAIGEFKLELQSGNAQSRSNSTIFRAVWPWNLTDDLEKQ